MRNLRGNGFAKILTAAEIHTSESGNPVMVLTVEFEQRKLAKGDLYAQRVQFRSFTAADHALMDQLRVGVFVTIDGDCDAVATKSPSGWWYANPRITGRILGIIDQDNEVTNG